MSEFAFNPLQGGWLAVESKATPMHVGGLLYFRPPRGADEDYVPALVRDWLGQTAVVEPWNLKLRPGPARGLQPGWQPDADFDLEYHFRHSALPAPGGERELGSLVSRLHSHRLDRARPLWECHLIEGLAGGRFALYLKVHPALFDGDGLLRMLGGFLADKPQQRGMRPPWCHTPARPPAAPRGASSPWAMVRAVADRLRGAAFLPILQELDEGVAAPADIDMGAEQALRFRAPCALMEELGAEEVGRVVEPLCRAYKIDTPQSLERVGSLRE